MYLTETNFKTNKIEKAKTYFLFSPEKGTREAHVLLQSETGLSTKQSWESLIEKLEDTEKELGFSKDSRLFMRVFFSDAPNQVKILRKEFPEYFDVLSRTSMSVIQQAPMPGSKLALWVYLVEGENTVEKSQFGRIFKSNGLSHIWTANLMENQTLNTFGQTKGMFIKYIQILEHFKSNMLLNAIRTWIYVRDVDTMYSDVVEARKMIFEGAGLTDETHFIASTGIEGRNEHPACTTFMDTYSVAGIKPAQIQYLTAPDNLCATSEYGVTFERGTSIQYGDRKHIFISGTASIDSRGEVLFPEDVEKQTVRVVENIEVLLNDASCNLDHVAMALVYLRDIADYETVKKMVDKLLPDVPAIITLAPVCRPAWLVEIEVIAIKQEKATFNPF